MTVVASCKPKSVSWPKPSLSTSRLSTSKRTSSVSVTIRIVMEFQRELAFTYGEIGDIQVDLENREDAQQAYERQ
jgi:hypothetical protein